MFSASSSNFVYQRQRLPPSILFLFFFQIFRILILSSYGLRVCPSIFVHITVYASIRVCAQMWFSWTFWAAGVVVYFEKYAIKNKIHLNWLFVLLCLTHRHHFSFFSYYKNIRTNLCLCLHMAQQFVPRGVYVTWHFDESTFILFLISYILSLYSSDVFFRTLPVLIFIAKQQ